MSDDRVEGTSADFNDDTPLIGHDDPVGGWVELGRTKLTTAGDTITVDNLPNKRYYMILADLEESGVVNDKLRFNGDSGSNYSYREQFNGGTDSSGVSQDSIYTSDIEVRNFNVGYIANLSNKEKISIEHVVRQSTAGEANAPVRRETVGKWANTTESINSITRFNAGAGDYTIGSEAVVLGYDPSDTHSTNFWKQLADVTATTDGEFDTSTFDSKKYLWVQYYMKPTGGTVEGDVRVGNGTLDTGSIYARRQSANGAADATGTSETKWITGTTTVSTPEFCNLFIINNATKEKLMIGHVVHQDTAGAGTEPKRKEIVGKWTNTTDQINIIGLHDAAGTGSIGTGSRIIVWGSD